MTLPTLTSPPARIMAGDTVEFTVSLPACPASAGGALTFSMAGPSKLAAVLGVADSDDWAFTLAEAHTTALSPGSYRWWLFYTADGKRRLAGEGNTVVEKDLSQIADGELTPFPEKLLPIVEAALTGTIEGEMKSFMIQGRQLSTFEPSELLKLRAWCISEINRARHGGFGTPIVYEFRSRC